MIKNRVVAAVYRILSAVIIIIGLVLGSGLKGGPSRFLSYTGQSNLLCAAFFLYAAGQSAADAATKGKRGCACCCPRFFGGALVTILFTMIIFWGILAPNVGGQRLFGAGNLILHTVSPVLMLLDYFLFCKKNVLKKRDAALFALFPTVYVAESLILGFSGFVFYTKDGVNYFFPYLFMDFNVLGLFAAGGILIISAAFIGTSFLLIFVNNKEYRRKNIRGKGFSKGFIDNQR